MLYPIFMVSAVMSIIRAKQKRYQAHAEWSLRHVASGGLAGVGVGVRQVRWRGWVGLVGSWGLSSLNRRLSWLLWCLMAMALYLGHCMRPVSKFEHNQRSPHCPAVV